MSTTAATRRSQQQQQQEQVNNSSNKNKSTTAATRTSQQQQQVKNKSRTTTQTTQTTHNTPPGAGHRVVVEGLSSQSVRLVWGLTGEARSRPGVTVAGGPTCTEDTATNIFLVWGSSPTPRWPRHGDCLLAGPVDAEPGDLGGQGQGGFWLRQEAAGGRGGGWVAAVVVGRSGAGCVFCCVCFLRRGGRCLCCADRRRGCPVLGQGCLARCCARHGLWSRQCCPWFSAVAVLGQGGDMPVVVHVVFFVLKTVEVPQLQYLDKVVAVFFVQFIKVADVPVIIQRQAPTVHVWTWRCPSSSSSTEWWTFLLWVQRRAPTVQTVQKTSEIPQVLFLDTVETPVVV